MIEGRQGSGKGITENDTQSNRRSKKRPEVGKAVEEVGNWENQHSAWRLIQKP